MSSVIIIAICLSAGFILRRIGIFSERSHETLSQFVIWISVPALTFVNMRKVSLESSLAVAAIAPWIIFLAGILFFRLLGRAGFLKRRDAGTLAALIIVCGLGNTSFVGFPLIEALIGPEGIPVATIYDQLGSFLLVSTLGVAIAASASALGASRSAIVWRVLKFPPFVAMTVTLSTRSIEIPPLLLEVAERLGSTLTPLALTAVGCQLSFSRPREGEFSELAWGLGYKLFLAPTLILILILVLRPSDPLVIQVSVLESAMSPMISAGIIASQFGLRPELNAKLVAYGTLISFATVPFWKWVVDLMQVH